MDIGTAKPDLDHRRQFSYHLIDILEPHEQYTAGMFTQRAEELCRNIVARGRIPVIEGGSVFYLHTFLTGMPATPAAHSSIRTELQQELSRFGPAALYSELQRVDPTYAERISAHDSYRIVRALEIFRQTGQPLSSFAIQKTVRSSLQPIVIGLQRDRGELYRRIDERVEQMFRRGLEQEIKDLISCGYGYGTPGLRAIGYQEFWDAEGNVRTSTADVCRLIQRNSRRFSKRQITFVNRIPEIQLIPADDVHALDRVLDHSIQRW